jgi:hypothetical protein
MPPLIVTEIKSTISASILVVFVCLLASTAYGQSASGSSMSDMGGGASRAIPINAPIPPITIDAGVEEIDSAGQSFKSDGSFSASGGVAVVGGTEFTLHADSVTGNLKTGISTAVGHVSMRELNSTIEMDSLFVSQKDNEGTAQNVLLRQPPYTIEAQRILFLSGSINAYSAVLTTCPPGPAPDFSIHARLITFLQNEHKIVIHDAAVFIGKKRVIEYRRLTLRVAGNGGTVAGSAKLITNAFGYTGFSGPYINFTSHFGPPQTNTYASLIIPYKHGVGGIVSSTVQLISQKRLPTKKLPKSLIGLVRQTAESTMPIVPAGDPLLLHWFQDQSEMNDKFQDIPNTITLSTTATASYLEHVYGRPTNDLFYSRLPELSFSAVVPISGPRELPTSRDPGQMRETLRQIALYAVVSPTIGRYSETPDNVTANRNLFRLDLESRPILIGNNLLFKPRLTYQTSSYPGTGDAFQFLQYDLALERYQTDRTGYGLEYQQSQEHGSSPFEFDTPYTAREVDGRVQVGTPKVILGGLVRYDLVNQNAYSEEILVAPIMRCIIPRFTYDFRTSSFGLGFDIQGLTF